MLILEKNLENRTTFMKLKEVCQRMTMLMTIKHFAARTQQYKPRYNGKDNISALLLHKTDKLEISTFPANNIPIHYCLKGNTVLDELLEKINYRISDSKRSCGQAINLTTGSISLSFGKTISSLNIAYLKTIITSL